MSMFKTARMLDLIERPLDPYPACAVCAAPTDVRDRGGRLWLECSSTPADEPRGLIARLGATPHLPPRRLIADLAEGVAARDARGAGPAPLGPPPPRPSRFPP